MQWWLCSQKVTSEKWGCWIFSGFKEGVLESSVKWLDKSYWLGWTCTHHWSLFPVVVSNLRGYSARNEHVKSSCWNYAFHTHLENVIHNYSDVLFCWTMITGEESSKEKILHEIIRLWITIHGFSFVKCILEKYRTAAKKKIKGLQTKLFSDEFKMYFHWTKNWWLSTALVIWLQLHILMRIVPLSLSKRLHGCMQISIIWLLPLTIADNIIHPNGAYNP